MQLRAFSKLVTIILNYSLLNLIPLATPHWLLLHSIQPTHQQYWFKWPSVSLMSHLTQK